MHGGVRITASIGIATYTPKQRFPSTLALLEAADHALYAAKLCGRNRFECLSRRSRDERSIRADSRIALTTLRRSTSSTSCASNVSPQKPAADARKAFRTIGRQQIGTTAAAAIAQSSVRAVQCWRAAAPWSPPNRRSSPSPDDRRSASMQHRESACTPEATCRAWVRLEHHRDSDARWPRRSAPRSNPLPPTTRTANKLARQPGIGRNPAMRALIRTTAHGAFRRDHADLCRFGSSAAGNCARFDHTDHRHRRKAITQRFNCDGGGCVTRDHQILDAATGSGIRPLESNTAVPNRALFVPYGRRAVSPR